MATQLGVDRRFIGPPRVFSHKIRNIESARSHFQMGVIVGLFTGMIGSGGVQRVGRHVAAVTSKFASDCGMKARFLSLNDSRGLHAVRVGPVEFSVSGYGRNRAEFVLAALRAAGRQPSLVIALHPHLAPLVWGMKVRNRKFRSIIFTHGIEVWHPLRWPRGPALRRADLVLAPSEDTVHHLISDQGVPPPRIQRLPWGLDPEFEARLATCKTLSSPNDFPRSGRVLLTVGRLDASEKYKGADTLISAMPGVLKTSPDTSLVLVGDGDDRPRLEQLARDLNVLTHTCFLHGLTPDELFACYAHCDVFALPSRGEGFGLVFLEAMAHAKPVIGGAHGGIPEIVEDGMTGLLVPHGDVEKLAHAIVSLLEDPARASEMGAKGRDRVAKIFSFAQFQSRLAQIMNAVLFQQH
jgi:phosphatidyl-myo-inositol dimannoside synthase